MVFIVKYITQNVMAIDTENKTRKDEESADGSLV